MLLHHFLFLRVQLMTQNPSAKGAKITMVYGNSYSYNSFHNYRIICRTMTQETDLKDSMF